jgi:hypothetical protein
MRYFAAILCLAASLAALASCDGTAASHRADAAGSDDKQSGAPSLGATPDDQPQTPGLTLEKSFDDIKFNIEKDEPFERSMLTGNVKELFDQRIRIRGYMYPTFKRKGIERFVLVRDNQECCFGPGAALYDCLRVTLQEGESIEYSHTPIAVEGQFKLDEFRDPQGTVRAVFHMVDAVVE